MSNKLIDTQGLESVIQLVYTDMKSIDDKVTDITGGNFITGFEDIVENDKVVGLKVTTSTGESINARYINEADVNDIINNLI